MGRIQAVDDIHKPVLQPSLAEAVHYMHYAGRHDLLSNSSGLHPAHFSLTCRRQRLQPES
jgi:hypothetical protein